MLTNKPAPKATSEHDEVGAVPAGPPLDLYVSGVVLPWTDEKKMIKEAREHADEQRR